MDSDLKKFSEFIKRLTSNDKYIINTLSELAMKVKDSQPLSKEIAKMAIGHIYKTKGRLKLISFYVVDSIIKNVGSPYKEMFSQIIVQAFVHTFQSIKDHDIRIKLYNLRITWKQFFSPSLMNDLDREVKRFDPAWPILLDAQTNNVKNDIKQNQTPTESNKSNGSSPDSTTQSDRDPRLNKIADADSDSLKRKSPINENFLIDRSGDSKIRKKMLEAPVIKEEPNTITVDEAFKVPQIKDLDLRVPQKSHEKVSNVKLEVFTKSESKTATIDDNKFQKEWTTDQLFKFIQEKNKNSKLSSDQVLPPPPIPITNRMVNNADALMQQVNSNLPKPREPTWKVHIEGFPQLPQIGTDPRLLSKCPFYDPYRTITIDENKYLLYLDRIQPCIYVNNYLHAVRFYFDALDVHINGMLFTMKSYCTTNIRINRRVYVSCIGGPGHELIINGWPYNVHIDGNLHQIKVSGLPVTVQIFSRRPVQVNVQNPIPAYICDWAINGFFGSPQYLSMAPLNPLRNPKVQDGPADQFRRELNPHMFTNARDLSYKTQPTQSADKSQPKEVKEDLLHSDINVHDLFKKLIATGILSPSKTVDLDLDLKKFSYDTFKVINNKEISELYCGHQCDLCGTRFKSKESKEFELHLDYHFLKNTAHTSRSKKVSRSYFNGVRQWLVGASANNVEPEFNYEQTSNLEQNFKCPVFEDPEKNKIKQEPETIPAKIKKHINERLIPHCSIDYEKCAVCMEKFEIEWDDEEDGFMLMDGQIKNGKAYHPICLEDADKQMIYEEDKDEFKDDSIVDLTKQPHAALQKVLEGNISSVVVSDSSSSGYHPINILNGSSLLNFEANSKIDEIEMDYKSASIDESDNTKDNDDTNEIDNTKPDAL